MRKLFGSALLLSSSFFFLTGFGQKHSSVETQSAVKEKGVELEFKIKPNKGMQISKDGPWSLQLVNTKGLKLETKDGKFETKTFDEALPGFKVKAELDGAAPTGKVEYTMKAFVCSDDKKHCYPQLHKGSLVWKKI